MDEKKVIVFSVYQYACGDIEANKKFEDLIRYMMSNHIILESGQMIIGGNYYIFVILNSKKLN